MWDSRACSQARRTRASSYCSAGEQLGAGGGGGGKTCAAETVGQRHNGCDEDSDLAYHNVKRAACCALKRVVSHMRGMSGCSPTQPAKVVCWFTPTPQLVYCLAR
jgi:hypothetical protein